MPVTYVQANSKIAGVASFPGPAAFPCAFTSDNSSGNLLIAFVTANTGTRPSSVTDTQGNVWEEVAQPVNVGDNFSMWVVQSCKPGPNTVSANGMTVTVAGGPSIIIAEFSLPRCTPCGLGIEGFNGPRTNSGFWPPFLSPKATFKTSYGPYFSTIIFGIYDNADGGAGVARTWSVIQTIFPVQSLLLIAQIQEDGGNNTTVLACSTVAYPVVYNECQLVASPSTPALHGDETNPYWILVNTTA